MVSRKWSCLLSSGHTLPRTAAAPPSPRCPRKPAPLAPITITSNSCVSCAAIDSSGTSEQLRIDAHAAWNKEKMNAGESDEGHAGAGSWPSSVITCISARHGGTFLASPSRIERARNPVRGAVADYTHPATGGSRFGAAIQEELGDRTNSGTRSPGTNSAHLLAAR